MKRILLTLSLLLLAGISVLAQGIGSAKDLQDFIQAFNKGESVLPWCDADSTVILTADIDLAKAKNLPQIATFNGHFDGRGFRLKNWKAAKGLFREVGENGLVENLIIDASCTLKSVGKGDEVHVGFIADDNRGIVRGCVNYGTVNHSCSFALAPSWVGGIVGHNLQVIHRCKNYGPVSSDTQGETKETVLVSVGGICGGTPGKVPAGASIVECENEGKVSAITNLLSFYIGGIAGYPGRATVKFCINRGEVLADISEPEDGKTFSTARIGGIAGQTKADIARCENYGTVTAKGMGGANIGGIVGMPHETLAVTDCLNYGDVTSKGDLPSQTGGICGNIGRPVHVHGCMNFGSVRFDGVSSRSRSTAGGIVGNVYVVKTATEGAYLRSCLNFGEVFAGSGGNKYEPANRNAIHAGGIIGCIESRDDVRSCVTDCGSYGSVKAVSGRTGNIYGAAISTRTGGDEPWDWAMALPAPTADGNLVGSVRTPDGEPWEGVVVSDGFQCTTTDAEGHFAFHSDLEKSRFVYLSLPANAVVPTHAGIPQFYKRIPPHIQAAEAHFILGRQEVPEHYTVMWIADPQVRPFGVDNSMETWHTRVAPDAEAFRAACTDPVYCINLGDLVYNFPAAWDDYVDGAAQIQCPTFNVIGNHDYDQGNLFDTNFGNVYYESYIGPTRYSFDLGDIHYLVFNDILYDRSTPKESYHYGIDEETLAWLRADLAYVPTDRIIMTCTHNNPFKTPNKSPHGSHNVYSLNYETYLALLSQYREVYAWNGHNHINFYYNYKGKDTTHGAPNIQCISVARATGALRLNRELGAKGEPQGYMVMDVTRGSDPTWYYKGVGTGKETQMRAYSPARTENGTVKVNIWNWSEGWSMPAWYENGVKVADFTYTPGVDPDYYDIFETVTNQTTRKYCTPSDEAILFTVTPTPGATSGEIRVTDLFGNEYRESVSW